MNRLRVNQNIYVPVNVFVICLYADVSQIICQVIIHGLKGLSNSTFYFQFCGALVAVLSLLADSVARFTVAPESEVAPATRNLPASRMDLALPPPGASTDVWVRRRMLYIMRGATRYRLTHAILPNGARPSPGQPPIHRDRRITVMCRPRPECVPHSQSGGDLNASYSYGKLG